MVRKGATGRSQRRKRRSCSNDRDGRYSRRKDTGGNVMDGGLLELDRSKILNAANRTRRQDLCRRSAAMNLNVNVQIAALAETLVTNLASEGAFLKMDSLPMDFKRTLSAKAFGTHVAFEGLLLEMDGSHMDFHVVLSAKAFATEGAFEGAGFQMDGGGVPVQTTLLAELESAASAGEGTSVVVGA